MTRQLTSDYCLCFRGACLSGLCAMRGWTGCAQAGRSVRDRYTSQSFQFFKIKWFVVFITVSVQPLAHSVSEGYRDVKRMSTNKCFRNKWPILLSKVRSVFQVFFVCPQLGIDFIICSFFIHSVSRLCCSSPSPALCLKPGIDWIIVVKLFC